MVTEEETTSSSRIFIKILFQEVAEYLGLRKLRERLNDPAMQGSFQAPHPLTHARTHVPRLCAAHALHMHSICAACTLHMHSIAPSMPCRHPVCTLHAFALQMHCTRTAYALHTHCTRTARCRVAGTLPQGQP